MARRIFKTVVVGSLVRFVEAATGKTALECDSEAMGENSARDVTLYGLIQLVTDAGASAETMDGKLSRMRERWQAITSDEYRRGTRMAGLVDGEVFMACVAVGLMRDTQESREKWGKLSRAARKLAEKRPEVAEWLEENGSSEGEGAAEEELEGLLR